MPISSHTVENLRASLSLPECVVYSNDDSLSKTPILGYGKGFLTVTNALAYYNLMAEKFCSRRPDFSQPLNKIYDQNQWLF